MASCILYHGPGARLAALEEADRIGRLLLPPVGDTGLKVDEARQVVDVLMSIPVGSDKGVLVIGPMDHSNFKSSDVLLKTIEEFDGRYVQPILWAHDLGGVTETVRSRCLDRWAPEAEAEDENDGLVALGYDLVQCSLEGELARLIQLVQGFLKKNSDRGYDLLRSISGALQERLHEESGQKLWARVRLVAMNTNPTAIEIISALLPEA